MRTFTYEIIFDLKIQRTNSQNNRELYSIGFAQVFLRNFVLALDNSLPTLILHAP